MNTNKQLSQLNKGSSGTSLSPLKISRNKYKDLNVKIMNSNIIGEENPFKFGKMNSLHMSSPRTLTIASRDTSVASHNTPFTSESRNKNLFAQTSLSSFSAIKFKKMNIDDGSNIYHQEDLVTPNDTFNNLISQNTTNPFIHQNNSSKTDFIFQSQNERKYQISQSNAVQKTNYQNKNNRVSSTPRLRMQEYNDSENSNTFTQTYNTSTQNSNVQVQTNKLYRNSNKVFNSRKDSNVNSIQVKKDKFTKTIEYIQQLDDNQKFLDQKDHQNQIIEQENLHRYLKQTIKSQQTIHNDGNTKNKIVHQSDNFISSNKISLPTIAENVYTMMQEAGISHQSQTSINNFAIYENNAHMKQKEEAQSQLNIFTLNQNEKQLDTQTIAQDTDDKKDGTQILIKSQQQILLNIPQDPSLLNQQNIAESQSNIHQQQQQQQSQQQQQQQSQQIQDNLHQETQLHLNIDQRTQDDHFSQSQKEVHQQQIPLPQNKNKFTSISFQNNQLSQQSSSRSIQMKQQQCDQMLPSIQSSNEIDSALQQYSKREHKQRKHVHNHNKYVENLLNKQLESQLAVPNSIVNWLDINGVNQKVFKSFSQHENSLYSKLLNKVQQQLQNNNFDEIIPENTDETENEYDNMRPSGLKNYIVQKNCIEKSNRLKTFYKFGFNSNQTNNDSLKLQSTVQEVIPSNEKGSFACNELWSDKYIKSIIDRANFQQQNILLSQYFNHKQELTSQKQIYSKNHNQNAAPSSESVEKQNLLKQSVHQNKRKSQSQEHYLIKDLIDYTDRMIDYNGVQMKETKKQIKAIQSKK